MTEAQDPKCIIAAYLDGARLVEVALSGASEAELDDAPDEENWTIRQIVHHLADGDAIWSQAVRMALGGGEPIFDLGWYWTSSQMEWSRNWAYALRDIRPALELLKASRRYIADLVESVPGAWACSVLVPWQGQEASQLTVGEILEMQTRHVCGHIAEIGKIRQQYINSDRYRSRKQL